MAKRGRKPRPVLDRIAMKIRGMSPHHLRYLLGRPELPDECWIWTGAMSRSKSTAPVTKHLPRSRPIVRIGKGEVARVERVLFEHWIGEPLPPHVQVRDHPKCTNPWCVNPAHKRLVAAYSHKLEEYPPLSYKLALLTGVHDEIEDLMDLIYEDRHLPAEEIQQKYPDFTIDEILEAKRRMRK